MTAETTGSIVRVMGLSKRYRTTTVLDNVSFEVAPGEFVALVGPSGAGKTTLFRCMTHLVKPDAGQVFVGDQALHAAGGRQLRRARREIGLIFQQFNLIRRLSAYDNVLAGRLGHVPTWRVVLRRFRYVDCQLALEALDQVGLLDHARQRADRLSGGQQQRVAIARVVAQQSRVILADEPVASLDPENAVSILALLRQIAHRQRIAVVCSLHQVELARTFADRVIGLRSGRVVADLPGHQFGAATQARIYGA